jgi:hypothetical protein
MELPSSKQQARAMGSKRFFNGLPCKHGHVSPRYTKSGQCCECRRLCKNDYRAKNLDKLREKDREYAKIYSEKRKENSICWRKQNPGKRAAQGGRRRATEKLAVPKWLSKDDEKEIKKIYSLAKWMQLVAGEEFHVDHLYPLTSDFMCGLHVPANLVVLSSKDNCSKSNYWWPGQLECQTGKGTSHEWWMELFRRINDGND